MAKRKIREEGASSERWLLTYADMITLVMAFFIMMFAMSQVDQAKFREAAEAIRAGFGNTAAIDSPPLLTGGGPTDFPPTFKLIEKNDLVKTTDLPQKLDFVVAEDDDGEPVSTPDAEVENEPNSAVDDEIGASEQQAQAVAEAFDATLKEVEQLTEVGAGIKEVFSNLGLTEDVSLDFDERGLVVRIKSDNILYELGQAELRAVSLPILDMVGTILTSVPNHVRVEGHTDSLPISTFRYPSNWELSTSRASSVVRYWLATGVLKADRISASGYADSRAVGSNNTVSGRALNRRVEVVVLWKGT